MAKKRKRSKKKRRSASSRSTRTQSKAREPKQSTQELFASEYHYVINDLKRFGALAVGMFALLIALALIIG